MQQADRGKRLARMVKAKELELSAAPRRVAESRSIPKARRPKPRQKREWQTGQWGGMF